MYGFWIYCNNCSFYIIFLSKFKAINDFIEFNFHQIIVAIERQLYGLPSTYTKTQNQLKCYFKNNNGWECLNAQYYILYIKITLYYAMLF